MIPAKTYRLLGPDGFYASETPGALGGNRPAKIYGRLDCPSAKRALAKGGYKEVRVFFADEAAALACGYRPCGKCLRDKYRAWRARLSGKDPNAARSEPPAKVD